MEQGHLTAIVGDNGVVQQCTTEVIVIQRLGDLILFTGTVLFMSNKKARRPLLLFSQAPSIWCQRAESPKLSRRIE